MVTDIQRIRVRFPSEQTRAKVEEYAEQQGLRMDRAYGELLAEAVGEDLEAEAP